MKLRYCVFVFIFILMAGCKSSSEKGPASQGNIGAKSSAVTAGEKSGPKDPVGEGAEIVAGTGEQEEPAFKPFNIYRDKGTRDNHYVPSGFMGDTECVIFDDTWQKDCQQGSSCIKITYDVKCSRDNQKWVGVYWLNPPNNWGKSKGGYDLTGATKLVFWAKGESGGEQIMEFTVGGIGGDYPDSDLVVIGPVILSSEWKQYTVDLRGRDLSYISGGFSWTTSEDVNPGKCVFYLDNIRFE